MFLEDLITHKNGQKFNLTTDKLTPKNKFTVQFFPFYPQFQMIGYELNRLLTTTKQIKTNKISNKYQQQQKKEFIQNNPKKMGN